MGFTVWTTVWMALNSLKAKDLAERVGFEFSVLLKIKEVRGANCPSKVWKSKDRNSYCPLRCPPGLVGTPRCSAALMVETSASRGIRSCSRSGLMNSTPFLQLLSQKMAGRVHENN